MPAPAKARPKARPMPLVAELDHRHYQDQHNLANALRPAARLYFVRHLAAALVEHGGAVDDHLADQCLLGTK